MGKVKFGAGCAACGFTGEEHIGDWTGRPCPSCSSEEEVQVNVDKKPTKHTVALALPAMLAQALRPKHQCSMNSIPICGQRKTQPLC